jgi:SAM-dependent methyltransferase
MMNPAEFANIARCERDFWWYRGMEQILFRILDPIAASRRVRKGMEAGCGTGHMSAHEGLLYGLRNGLHHLMAQADIAALPFPSALFDVVASLDVIAHFPRGQEQRAFAELARVLAPGGLLVVRASALDVLVSRHSEFTLERQRFTRKRLIQSVTDQGIRVLRCTYANSLLLPVAFTKFRILEPLLRAQPESGVQPVAPWLDRLLFSALRMEAAWLGSGRNLPLGQSLILIGERIA